jgi:hypothetical protein
MERLVVQVAPDKFDVIEGVKMNRAPLSQAEADSLAKGSPASVVAPAAPEKPSPDATVSAPEPSPPAPVLPDLRPTGWDAAGGSCGFRIKGGPTW